MLILLFSLAQMVSIVADGVSLWQHFHQPSSVSKAHAKAPTDGSPPRLKPRGDLRDANR
jgi:hypothetical protein